MARVYLGSFRGCARRVSLSRMPPTLAFGWLCVVHTIADIAFRAAQIRSVQALPKSSSQIPPTANRSHGGPTSLHTAETDTRTSLEPFLHLHVTEKVTEGSVVHEESSLPRQLNVTTSHQDSSLSPRFSATESDVNVGTLMSLLQGTTSVTQLTLSAVVQPIETAQVFPTVDPQNIDPVIIRNLQSSKVPSSRIGRLFHYGGTFEACMRGMILICSKS